MKTSYEFAGNATTNPLAIGLESEEGIQIVTVNLPDNIIPLRNDRAFYDINNAPISLLEEWIEDGKAIVIGQMSSGFCTYPLLQFDENFIEKLEER